MVRSRGRDMVRSRGRDRVGSMVRSRVRDRVGPMFFLTVMLFQDQQKMLIHDHVYQLNRHH